MRYFTGPDGFYFEEFSRFTKFSANRNSSSDSIVKQLQSGISAIFSGKRPYLSVSLDFLNAVASLFA